MQVFLEVFCGALLCSSLTCNHLSTILWHTQKETMLHAHSRSLKIALLPFPIIILKTKIRLHKANAVRP